MLDIGSLFGFENLGDSRMLEGAMQSESYRFPVDAFILAGGVSSRMGRDKGLLRLGGVPLIVRTVKLVEPLVASTAVVGAPERYGKLGFRVIPDQEFGLAGDDGRSKGPLGGIATALLGGEATWNLVLACDLPYLSREWLEWLLARAVCSNAQAIIPETARGLEPLAAVYRRECAATLAQSLRSGVRKVTEAFSKLSVEAIFESEWEAFDPDGRILKNMNTPSDYEEASAWWKSKEAHKKDK